MWDNNRPILDQWNAGPIVPEEVLYEYDGPTIFTARVGLALFLFFKKDELENSDIFIAAPVIEVEIDLLKRGGVSVRGLLSYREAWLVQADLDLRVERYQSHTFESIEPLLPKRGLGLRAHFGVVPDSVDQANAFFAFKFISPSMSTRSMPLTVFRGLVDDLSELVRKTLVPQSLATGRDSRYFDVQIGEPKFASLLITIQQPDIDAEGLRSNPRTRELEPEALRAESSFRGQRFWESVEATTAMAALGELEPAAAIEHHFALTQLATLLPSEANHIDQLQISFGGHAGSRMVTIDKAVGGRLVRAEAVAAAQARELSGVIVEVNGEARTFILKDVGGRQTTCAPSRQLFELLEQEGHLVRGVQMRIWGNFWRRTRRDYIYFDQYPDILN